MTTVEDALRKPLASPAVPITVSPSNRFLIPQTAENSRPPTIESRVLEIRDLHYHPSPLGTRDPATITFADDSLTSTNRFRNSMLGLIGQSHSIFRLFGADEVFDRVQSADPTRKVRVVYEKETGRALSLVQDKRVPVSYDELSTEVLGGAPIHYCDGVIRTMMKPFRSEAFMIHGDAHQPRQVLEVPLDAYGSVNSFLALLREVCSNGAIGMAAAFRCTIKMGDADKPVPNIKRFQRSFYDEDGYADLRNRIEAAGNTMASVAEFCRLLKLLQGSNLGLGVLAKVEQALADTQEYYGLATINAIDEKRARLTPTQMTVYDLTNMASELATHVVDNPYMALKLQGMVGEILSKQFDLEGLKARTADGGFTPTFFVSSEVVDAGEKSGFGIFSAN